ncbi:hypothetical protein GPECTOR_2g1059 [Gonium pectorale]|uniref:Uncharacterized protein n=1 Tax=Gonium pectorale TaxID=33097 RepID=A0A150H1Q3_GONPE|nr:hypothetical protein GPECTOR_2g1059 [Gonium pectorale]|eukprot:KXZ55510.1 hypothetical protein GPECTOR_2g1059 [Gonium pectorale]
MDCTLGITLAIAFHRLMHRFARWRHALLVASRERDHEHPWTEALLESGNYGDPPIARRWAIQAAGWVICVVSARLSVGATVLSTLRLMAALAHGLDAAFRGRPEAELFTVMVGIPMLLNVGQAWIQDQVLKWTARRRIKRGMTESLGSGSDAPLLQHSSGSGSGGSGSSGNLLGGGEMQVQVLIAAASGAGRNRAGSDKAPLMSGMG